MGIVWKVRRNVSNSGDTSAGDQLQARPWGNRTRGLQPVAFSQKGHRPGNHTKGGRLQSHGAGQQVAQQGRGQGLSTKSAHEAGIHQSQEHVANHVEVLTRPLSAREVKASVFGPRGFFIFISNIIYEFDELRIAYPFLKGHDARTTTQGTGGTRARQPWGGLRWPWGSGQQTSLSQTRRGCMTGVLQPLPWEPDSDNQKVVTALARKGEATREQET
jgi:hypothetical protein